MKQHFYTHITEYTSLYGAIDALQLEPHEKEHLTQLIEVNLHHTVLDAILSELSVEDKKLFLQLIADDDHEKIWEFLNKKIDTIEDKIKQAADGLKEELHKDVQDVS